MSPFTSSFSGIDLAPLSKGSIQPFTMQYHHETVLSFLSGTEESAREIYCYWKELYLVMVF